MGRERTSRCRVLPLLVLCCVILSAELRAQAIVAPSGRTLFNRATLIRSFVEIQNSSVQADGKSVDITQYVTPLAVVYGVYPKWTVIVAQPYVAVDETSRIGNQRRGESSSGLADLQLFAQYDGLYSRNAPGGLTRLTGVFGLRAPTGARRFSTGAAGYTGGLIFEKVARLKYVLTADFEYTFATENDAGVSVGDHARFDVVPAYFMLSEGNTLPDAGWLRKLYARAFRNGTYLILELNGTWRGHARKRGTDIANTGGTTLSISPGIQYFLSRSFLVEFSSPIPVVTALNGTQPERDSTFLVGFRYLF